MQSGVTVLQKYELFIHGKKEVANSKEPPKGILESSNLGMREVGTENIVTKITAGTSRDSFCL